GGRFDERRHQSGGQVTAEIRLDHARVQRVGDDGDTVLLHHRVQLFREQNVRRLRRTVRQPRICSHTHPPTRTSHDARHTSRAHVSRKRGTPDTTTAAVCGGDTHVPYVSG